jgi:hypothetical protein
MVASITRFATTALALVLAGPAYLADPAAAQPPPELKNEMIEVEYNEPKDQKYRPSGLTIASTPSGACNENWRLVRTAAGTALRRRTV